MIQYSKSLELSIKYTYVASAMSEGLRKALENDFESIQIPKGVLKGACCLFRSAAQTVNTFETGEIPTLEQVDAYVFVGEILRMVSRYNTRKEVDIDRVRLSLLTESLGDLEKTREYQRGEYERLQLIFGKIAKVGEELAFHKWATNCDEELEYCFY